MPIVFELASHEVTETTSRMGTTAATSQTDVAEVDRAWTSPLWI